jgi:ribitol-5-phosphate 2-dehydrogenase (NADP+) / D-ribitol-5-phosphate cytidylyltransferase
LKQLNQYTQLAKKKIVLFGASSGIGKEVKKLCEYNGAEVKGYGSRDLDFTELAYVAQLPSILAGVNYVINCAGIIGDNTVSYEKTFDINVRPSWEILNFYLKNKNLKDVSIILIGSSAYKAGRKNYILYAATKAALVNMAQGASEALAEQRIKVNVFNPPKTDTPMLRNFRPDEDRSTWADPKDVADGIVQLLISGETGKTCDFQINN